MGTTSGPLRILIVDDCPDTTATLACLLQLWGYQPLVARDGFEAVDMARTQQPDAVLLDLGLPGLDGYEVARQLRSYWGRERPLLVAVTGYGQDEFRRLSQAVGFDDFLIKPVAPEEIRRLLDQRLRGKTSAPVSLTSEIAVATEQLIRESEQSCRATQTKSPAGTSASASKSAAEVVLPAS